MSGLNKLKHPQTNALRPLPLPPLPITPPYRDVPSMMSPVDCPDGHLGVPDKVGGERLVTREGYVRRATVGLGRGTGGYVRGSVGLGRGTGGYVRGTVEVGGQGGGQVEGLPVEGGDVVQRPQAQLK